MMDYDDYSLETEFMGLLDSDPSHKLFHESAKTILGDNYKELGSQIVEDMMPSMKAKFDSYFKGDDANKEPAKKD
jgi:hypothetical protein